MGFISERLKARSQARHLGTEYAVEQYRAKKKKNPNLIATLFADQKRSALDPFDSDEKRTLETEAVWTRAKKKEVEARLEGLKSDPNRDPLERGRLKQYGSYLDTLLQTLNGQIDALKNIPRLTYEIESGVAQPTAQEELDKEKTHYKISNNIYQNLRGQDSVYDQYVKGSLTGDALGQIEQINKYVNTYQTQKNYADVFRTMAPEVASSDRSEARAVRGYMESPRGQAERSVIEEGKLPLNAGKSALKTGGKMAQMAWFNAPMMPTSIPAAFSTYGVAKPLIGAAYDVGIKKRESELSDLDRIMAHASEKNKQTLQRLKAGEESKLEVIKAQAELPQNRGARQWFEGGPDQLGSKMWNIVTAQEPASWSEYFTSVQDLPGNEYMDKGWGPFKFKHGVGLGMDIGMNPLTYATPAEMAGFEKGKLASGSLEKLLGGINHPAAQRAAAMAQKLEGPVGTALTLPAHAPGAVAKGLGFGYSAAKTGEKKLAEIFKRRMPRTAGSAERGMAHLRESFHPQPLMSKAEKDVLFAKNAQQRLVHGIAGADARAIRLAEKKVPESVRKSIWEALASEDDKALSAAWKSGGNIEDNIMLTQSWMKPMREVAEMEIESGHLKYVRNKGAGYVPRTIIKGQEPSLARNIVQDLKGMAQPAENVTPNLLAGKVTGKNFFSYANMPRSSREWAEFIRDMPAVTDPAEATILRETHGLNLVARNNTERYIAQRYGVMEDDMLADMLVQRGVHPDVAYSETARKSMMDQDALNTLRREVQEEMEGRGYVKRTYRTGNRLEQPVEEAGGRWKVAGPHTNTNYYIEKRTSNFMDSLHRPSYPVKPKGGDLGDIMVAKGERGLRRATDWWRTYATVARPRYMAKRIMGDMTRMYQGGIVPSPRTMKEVAQILGGKTERTFPRVIKLKGGQEITHTQFRNLLKDLDIGGGGSLDAGSVYAKSNPTSKYNPLSRQGFWVKGMRKVERGWNEPARAGAFLQALKESGNLDEALAKLDKTMFNFRDLAPTEGRLKTLIPFYGWSRKNLPFQASTLLKDPGKFVPFASAFAQMRGGEGVPSWLPPDYLSPAGYQPTNMKYKNKDIWLKTGLPFENLGMLTGPFDEPGQASYMFNPFIKGGAETLGMLMGGDEGKKKNIAPFLGKLLSNVSEGTSLGVDEYTGKTVWQTPELFSQLIQQVPALQDLNMMFRNDRDDQLFRIINKLTGADIVPVDYEEQLQRRMAESGAEMTKQRDALAKALGYEIKTPEYDYTELAIPPSSTKMFEEMQGFGLPLTEEGYEEAKRLLAEEKGYEGKYYSKMEWPTLEELKKVRKGRISVLFKGPKGFIPGYQANPVQQFMSEDEFRRIIGQ